MLEDIIPGACRVLGDVFRPQDGRFLPVIQEVRVHIVVGTDDLDLFFRDACRLTKRRVVGQSVFAPVGVAGLDDDHFLELGGEAATAAFPLHNRSERRQHHLHEGCMGGDTVGVWNAPQHFCCAVKHQLGESVVCV